MGALPVHPKELEYVQFLFKGIGLNSQPFSLLLSFFTIMQIDEVYRIAFEAFTNALDQKLTTPDTDVALAQKFYHGTIVLQPKDLSLQSKEVDIEVFFKKIIAIRNNLRVLEQKINSSKLEDGEKIELEGYITRSYGSLTTFNVLFQDNADKFVGAKGE
jgi:superoxide dismutase